MHLKSLKEVLILHTHLIKSSSESKIFTCNNLIHFYAKYGRLHDAHKVFDEMPERNVFTWNTIIATQLRNNDVKHAEHLFNSCPCRDLVTYNTMLSGYVGSDVGCETCALKLFREMQCVSVCIDEFTVTTMLNLVAKLGVSSLGVQLHCYMVKSGNDSTGFSSSSLIDMYSKCGCFHDAVSVFDSCNGGLDLVTKNAAVAACCREGELGLALDIFWRKPDLNDTVSWNTIISGFTQRGFHQEAIELFTSMVENGVGMNEHTFATLLGACSGMKSVNLGKEVHARVLKDAMIENPYISSGIVDVYCKCGNMEHAKSAYTEFCMGNAFAVASMIVGYSLVGNMVEARRLFDSLLEKNSVVWTAMFSGYVKSRECEAAFELFRELIAKEASNLDGLIFMNVLSVCAIQASLHPGKQIHSYILRAGIETDEKLLSTMVDMYSKCGNITYAERIFTGVTDRDSVLYNVMIAGYAYHGCEAEAIKLFDEMCERGTKPNAATFIALLSTCRHAGSVHLGEKYFYTMENKFGIQPEIDHYACMVDLYGRAHYLEKAVELMNKMSIEPDAVLWGAFLNACKLNGNVELAREAEENLMRIEGESGSRYVQLANVYAEKGDWEEVGRIRGEMKGKEVKKLAGCSWLYMEERVIVFTSSDISHPRSNHIYSLLGCLVAEINHLALAAKGSTTQGTEIVVSM